MVVFLSGCVAVTDEIGIYYNVSFETGVSAVVAAQSVEEGALVERPVDPVKEHNEFTGWYVDAACTVKWNFASDTVQFNMTLYAGYSLNEYTVVFDTVTDGILTTISVSYGSKIQKPLDSQRSGYQLTGWCTASSQGPVWEFALNSVTSNTTLYARWINDRGMVSVPGGSFRQENEFNDSFDHTVSSFSIGRYEVTYRLWYDVYSWAIDTGLYTFSSSGFQGSLDTPETIPGTNQLHPVTCVSWRDAIVWCNAYSEKNGLEPVYFSDSNYTAALKDATVSGEYATNAGGVDDPYVKWSATGYRLPTEGEWQYAAAYTDGNVWLSVNYASGAAGDYQNKDATGQVAWYSANTGTTRNVGLKQANALGVYDMSGNAAEWCWDWLKARWDSSTRTDYRGPDLSSLQEDRPLRVRRGGGFDWQDLGLRVGVASAAYPGNMMNDYGFRVVRSSP